jgi:hypothetical protein
MTCGSKWHGRVVQEAGAKNISPRPEGVIDMSVVLWYTTVARCG